MNQELASGSLRRQAQWLNKYPTHKVVYGGNVNSRMKKLERLEQAVLQRSLERINLKPDDFIDLDWMIPPPAQGQWSCHAKRCIYTECFITVK
jgi:hydroxymethylbilane synthase